MSNPKAPLLNAPKGASIQTAALLCALVLGVTGNAMAQSAAVSAADQEITEVFAKADANGDKALSPEEAKSLPAVAEQFAKFDTNGNGSISQAEFVKAMKGA